MALYAFDGTRNEDEEAPGQRLGIRVGYAESALRDRVKAAGGIWRPRHKLWELPYEEVVALGLESRVVGDESRET